MLSIRSGQKPRYYWIAVLLILGVVLYITDWLAPTVATWILTGRWVHITFMGAQAAIIRAMFSFHNADIDYPPLAHAAVHQHVAWWTLIVLMVLAEFAFLTAIYFVIDAAASQPVIDRRWYQLRGLNPRHFARPHIIRHLLIRAPRPDRVVVGKYNSRLLAVGPDTHLGVIAPTGSGKSAAEVIPVLLEHQGAAIVTSVRTDIHDITIARRRQLGHVWVLNLYGDQSDSLDLLHGCEDWSRALQVGRWLTQATQRNKHQTGNIDYFEDEGEALVSSMIHAAAIMPQYTILDVYRWTQEREEQEVLQILQSAGAEDAARRFNSAHTYNDRQRDGIIGMLNTSLKAYADPRAATTVSRDATLTPENFFAAGQSNTLYIVAGVDEQKLVAPLIVTLISSMFNHIDTQHNKGSRHGQLPLLAALDETFNIAPLQELPRMLSHARGHTRFMTVWQNISQMIDLYGREGADALLDSSQAKLFLGSSTDEATTKELHRLIGRRAAENTPNPDLVTNQITQRMKHGQSLLIHGSDAPVWFKQRRWYKDNHLRELAGVPRLTILNRLKAAFTHAY